MTGTVAVEVVIRGRVQGVWFRAWTEREATRRSLSGWVRNNPDRTVSALFIGRPALIEDMLEACRQGPPDARVDGVETLAVDPPPQGTGFRVLR